VTQSVYTVRYCQRIPHAHFLQLRIAGRAVSIEGSTSDGNGSRLSKVWDLVQLTVGNYDTDVLCWCVIDLGPNGIILPEGEGFDNDQRRPRLYCVQPTPQLTQLHHSLTALGLGLGGRIVAAYPHWRITTRRVETVDLHHIPQCVWSPVAKLLPRLLLEACVKISMVFRLHALEVLWIEARRVEAFMVDVRVLKVVRVLIVAVSQLHYCPDVYAFACDVRVTIFTRMSCIDPTTLLWIYCLVCE
jgi:hypothetical protein